MSLARNRSAQPRYDTPLSLCLPTNKNTTKQPYHYQIFNTSQWRMLSVPNVFFHHCLPNFNNGAFGFRHFPNSYDPKSQNRIGWLGLVSYLTTVFLVLLALNSLLYWMSNGDYHFTFGKRRTQPSNVCYFMCEQLEQRMHFVSSLDIPWYDFTTI